MLKKSTGKINRCQKSTEDLMLFLLSIIQEQVQDHEYFIEKQDFEGNCKSSSHRELDNRTRKLLHHDTCCGAGKSQQKEACHKERNF